MCKHSMTNTTTSKRACRRTARLTGSDAPVGGVVGRQVDGGEQPGAQTRVLLGRRAERRAAADDDQLRPRLLLVQVVGGASQLQRGVRGLQARERTTRGGDKNESESF